MNTMITNIELEKDVSPNGAKRYTLRFYVSGRSVPIDLWIYDTQDKLSFINSLLDFIKAVMFYDVK